MTVHVCFHAGLKKQLSASNRKTHKVHAQTFMEVLAWGEQLLPLADYMKTNAVEIRVGKTLADSRSMKVEQVAKWSIPNGAVIHILPATKGYEITTSMIVTALVTAAISIGVSILMMFLTPSSTSKSDTRKNALYQNGMQTNKEGVPLPYLAGRRVFAGGNVIEGNYDYTMSGSSLSALGFSGLFNASAALMGKGDDGGFAAAIQTDSSQVQSDIITSQTEAGITSYKGKGGGKTISNTVFSDATISFAMAIGAGEIGGIVGSNGLEKSKNILVNEVPLIDPGTGQPNYHGISWEERYGIEGQDALRLTPGTAEPQTAGVDLTFYTVADGSTRLYVPKTVSSPSINRVKLDFRVNQLLKTSDKGNQSQTSVVVAADVKRANDANWTNAGTWSIFGKSTQAFDRTFEIRAPAGADADDSPWLFRVYRVTADSDDDKLQNSTTFQGYVEIIDKDYTYDGTETVGAVPTALFAAQIDMSSFNISDKPEIALIVEGQKVRVPSNYDPEANTYSGSWDGTWSYRATSNPVWHWLEIATSKTMGCGFPDEFFNKFDLYPVAKRCDETVNGRTRYTLNKQFTDQTDGWQALQDLAQTFRAFPYYNGSQIVLCQDAPGTASHAINNSHVENGSFSYTSVPGEQQYNEIIVQWDNPDDYYRVASVKYQDADNIAIMRKHNVSNNGIISKTIYKTGCTNRQEAYDYAKAICWSAVNENRMVAFNTAINACAYVPGQRILIDDWNVTGKEWVGRIRALTDSQIQLDAPMTFKAFDSYDALLIVDNQLSRRPITMFHSDTKTNLITVDLSGVAADTPISIVNNDPHTVQPTEWRITTIEEVEAGKFQVSATLHIEDKFEFVDHNMPVHFEPWSQVSVITPTPTNAQFSTYSYIDDILGASHGIDMSWDKINSNPTANSQGMALAGYTVEVMRPNSGVWEKLYSGTNNSCTLLKCDPGAYSFSLRSISILGKSSSALVATYVLGSNSVSSVSTPILDGFR